MNLNTTRTIRVAAIVTALAALAACSTTGTTGPSTAASPTTAATPATALKFSFEGSPPAGWAVSGEDGLLSFAIEEDEGSMTLELLPNRALMDHACELRPEPGVATAAGAIADAVASRPGLTASGRTSVTVAGLAGEQMDLHVDPAVGVTCPADAAEFVPLVGFGGPAGWEFIGLAKDEATRFIVVDAPGGQNVVVVVFASDQAMFDRHIDEAASILEGITIGS